MGINTSLSLALSNFIRQKMRRLNQISQTYSFESTKISIWFGACKMRRLNRALESKLQVKLTQPVPSFLTWPPEKIL